MAFMKVLKGPKNSEDENVYHLCVKDQVILTFFIYFLTTPNDQSSYQRPHYRCGRPSA